LAIKYLDAKRIRGTATERTALSGNTYTAVPQTSWKEIGRTTLSSESDTIDVSITGSVKSNLTVLAHLVQDSANTGSSPNFYVNFGYSTIDTGSNYAYKRSHGGATDSTSTSQTSLGGWGEYGEYFLLMTIRNVATKEKLVFLDTCAAGGTGARAPARTEIVGKWANTSNQLDKIRVTNTSAGNYGVGSEVVVLGCDDDEADSGTNFWTEVAHTKLTSASSTLSTGTFTTKKYLWYQISFPSASGTADLTMQNGNGTIDTGSNYHMKYNCDGGSQGSSTSNTKHDGVMNMNHSTAGFGNVFLINKADKEKLFIPHRLNAGGAGASNVPQRGEGTSKWSNTSAQINIITYTKISSQTLPAGSSIRVWGSD